MEGDSCVTSLLLEKLDDDLNKSKAFLYFLRTSDKGKMQDKINYRIQPVEVEDSDDVIEFLRKFFFKDEPLNICVGLLDEPGSSCEELENFCLESISDGVSLMALSPSNEILGVCINGAITKEKKKADMNESVESCSNPKFKKILRLLQTVSIESNLFEKFPDVDRCFEMQIISVNEACRGQGIAKSLAVKCCDFAKEKGFRLVKTDCTSHFTALMTARLGFHCIYTLNYSDYLDEKGDPVFVPEPPHTCVKTYVKHC